MAKKNQVIKEQKENIENGFIDDNIIVENNNEDETIETNKNLHFFQLLKELYNVDLFNSEQKEFIFSIKKIDNEGELTFEINEYIEPSMINENEQNNTIIEVYQKEIENYKQQLSYKEYELSKLQKQLSTPNMKRFLNIQKPAFKSINTGKAYEDMANPNKY